MQLVEPLPWHALFKEIFNSILEAKLEGDVSTKEDEIEFVNKRFGRLLNN